MNWKALAVTLIAIIVLVVFTAGGWAAYRSTTTRVLPGQPPPTDTHPAVGCVWCHIVEE